MDMKKLLLDNALLRHERDSAIRLDYAALEARLLSIIKVPSSGEPEVTYTMPLDEAIKWEIHKDGSLITSPTRRQMPLGVTARSVARAPEMAAPYGEDQEKFDETSKEEKEALDEAAQGIADKIDSQILEEVIKEQSPPVEDSLRLYNLSEKLLGLESPPFELTDKDKQVIRASYQRFVGSKSMDEFDDLKTLIETFKAQPDELDQEIPKLKPIIDKALSYYA